MSSLRKGNVQAVNFFMFVDILTCVTGIIILIALLLSTQLRMQALTPVPAPAAPSVVLTPLPPPVVSANFFDSFLHNIQFRADALKLQVKTLQAFLQELLRDIANLKAEIARRRMAMKPVPGVAKRLEPLLVTVAGQTAKVERFRVAGSKVLLPVPATGEGFAAALQHFDPHQFYVVFYIKPSGIATFADLKATARAAGFEVGYDAMEEDAEIEFSALK
jgi:hypothetical protein